MEEDVIMSRRNHSDGLSAFLVAAVVGFPVLAQPTRRTSSPSFSVGVDQAFSILGVRART
jgi:hypothetical protein